MTALFFLFAGLLVLIGLGLGLAWADHLLRQRDRELAAMRHQRWLTEQTRADEDGQP